MGESRTKFRQGTGGVQFHPVPFLLLRDAPRNNILVGDDAVQIRFMEQLTDMKCETRERVSDEDLFGKDGILIRVLTAQGVDLSSGLRNKTGVWSLTPLTPASVSTNALVRAASELLKTKYKKEELEAYSRYVGRMFEREELSDLRVGLWETVYLMTTTLPPTRWKEPWEAANLQEWVPPGVDLGLRFGSLFRTLRAYILIKTGAEPEVKKMGFSPHKMLQLKELTINPEKVHESVRVLSRWKNFNTDPRIIALSLTRIWHG